MALFIGGTSALKEYVERVSNMPVAVETEEPAVSRVTLSSSTASSVQVCDMDGVYIPEAPCSDCSFIIDDVVALQDAVTDLNADMAEAQGNITALQSGVSALSNNKVDKVAGKGLSTNDYSNAEKQKVASLVTKVAAIEALLGDKQNTVIAMTDSNNNEVSVTVLAE